MSNSTNTQEKYSTPFNKLYSDIFGTDSCFSKEDFFDVLERLVKLDEGFGRHLNQIGVISNTRLNWALLGKTHAKSKYLTEAYSSVSKSFPFLAKNVYRKIFIWNRYLSMSNKASPGELDQNCFKNVIFDNSQKWKSKIIIPDYRKVFYTDRVRSKLNLSKEEFESLSLLPDLYKAVILNENFQVFLADGNHQSTSIFLLRAFMGIEPIIDNTFINSKKDVSDRGESSEEYREFQYICTGFENPENLETENIVKNFKPFRRNSGEKTMKSQPISPPESVDIPKLEHIKRESTTPDRKRKSDSPDRENLPLSDNELKKVKVEPKHEYFAFNIQISNWVNLLPQINLNSSDLKPSPSNAFDMKLTYSRYSPRKYHSIVGLLARGQPLDCVYPSRYESPSSRFVFSQIILMQSRILKQAVLKSKLKHKIEIVLPTELNARTIERIIGYMYGEEVNFAKVHKASLVKVFKVARYLRLDQLCIEVKKLLMKYFNAKEIQQFQCDVGELPKPYVLNF